MNLAQRERTYIHDHLAPLLACFRCMQAHIFSTLRRTMLRLAIAWRDPDVPSDV